MTTEVAQLSPAQQLAQRVRGDAMRSQVAAAVPAGVDPGRFVRVAATAILHNPAIAECEEGSVFRAVLQCAADGLFPNGREAAIVPFKKEATYIPMIGGLRKVAGAAGYLLDAYLIHAKDRFSWDPTVGVSHIPPPFPEDRGDIIGVYAFATNIRTGRRIYDEPMTRADIEKVRAVSRVSNKPGTPWVEWYGEMAKKTAARRCFKKIPLPDLDEIGERIVQQVDADIDLDPMGYEELAAATDLPPVDPAALESGEATAEAGTTAASPGGATTPAASLDDLEAVVVTESDGDLYTGKTLDQVAAAPGGMRWLKWCAQHVTHPQCPEAAAYLEAIA